MKKVLSILLAVVMLFGCMAAITGCKDEHEAEAGDIGSIFVKSDYEKLYDYIKENGTLTSGGYYVTTNTQGNYNYGFMISDENKMLWYLSGGSSTESFMTLTVSENAVSLPVSMSFGDDTIMTGTIYPASYSSTNKTISGFSHNSYSSLTDTYKTLCETTLSLMMVYIKKALPSGVTMSGLGFTSYI